MASWAASCDWTVRPNLVVRASPFIGFRWHDRGMTRIEDYALLGDLQTAALVGNTARSTGSACRVSTPRPASPHCSTPPTPGAGHRPGRRRRLHPAPLRRRHLVLETEWDTPEGTVRVIDFMPPRGRGARPRPDRRGRAAAPSHAQRAAAALRLRPRRALGRATTATDRRPSPARTPCACAPPSPTEGQTGAPSPSSPSRAGERIPFVLTWCPSHEPPPKPVDAEDALRDTVKFWTDWSTSGTPCTGPYRDAVKRSLITLKALTYAPTGGIVAAATTSLPEQLGGPATGTTATAGCGTRPSPCRHCSPPAISTEAKAWREWLLRAVAGDPADLQIMYALDGTRRLPEAELPWLAGYEGSTPVRMGNAAADQFQLDVWGEVLDGLPWPATPGSTADDDAWDLQVALMDLLEGNWHQPDNGLWEMRGPRRHFTHSKVMAWVAVDRMARAVRTHPTCPARSTAGSSCATPSTPTSARTASTPTGTPSPSPTAAPAWTPACC